MKPGRPGAGAARLPHRDHVRDENMTAGAQGLAARLEAHVRELAERIGERNVYRADALAEAERYIQETWRDAGYDVTRQTYDVGGVPCSNLEITRRGSRRPDEILLIGAHYDSVHGSPGANDNGSGVAGILELARELADADVERTIRLVGFVNEESPFFFGSQMGSMVYARAARERGDDIRLMLSLEMIGSYSDRPGSQQYPPLFRYFYPDRGNFIAFVSNIRSRRALKLWTTTFERVSDFPCESAATFSWVPGVAWSDHLSFWRAGYRAIMVTDTAFYRYRHYHEPTDLPDEIDYASMATVTAGIGAAARALADDPAVPRGGQ